MMAKPKAQCVGCRHAAWRTTERGTLHPSGGGRCTWAVPEVFLPKAFYWIGSDRPTGGYIDRNDSARFADCPQFSPKD